MTGVKILIGVVLALFLLSLVRLGGGAKYSQDGLYVRLRFGRFSFLVYPRKKREEKSPRPAKEKPEKEKAERGGPLELAKQYLPLVCEAAGELKRRIRIDTLWLDLTVATDNPASAAMAYGYANMTLGMIWPLIEQNFEVKDPRIHTGVDFQSDVSVFYINAAFSARLGQLVSFGFRFGWKFIRIYMKNRPKAPQNPHKNAERGDQT